MSARPKLPIPPRLGRHLLTYFLLLTSHFLLLTRYFKHEVDELELESVRQMRELLAAARQLFSGKQGELEAPQRGGKENEGRACLPRPATTLRLLAPHGAPPETTSRDAVALAPSTAVGLLPAPIVDPLRAF